MAALQEVHARRRDWLLMAGFLRSCSCSDISGNVNEKVVSALGLLFCSAAQWERAVACQARFESRQSFWRMLQQHSRGSTSTSNTCFNAWNYPLMPNRKDPSDHFAICCDVVLC